MLIAETVLVAQVIEGVAGADLIGLLAQQLQAAAHLHPMVEGASQGDRGQMRGIEDKALLWGDFNFDIGRRFSKGDFSLTSIADAKPANGMLGPTFMGMVMRWVVVVVGPITASRHWAGGTRAVVLGHDCPHMSSSRQRAHGDFSCAVQLKAVAWVTSCGRGQRSRLESVAARRRWERVCARRLLWRRCSNRDANGGRRRRPGRPAFCIALEMTNDGRSSMRWRA
jgi:hypothetical protein